MKHLVVNTNGKGNGDFPFADLSNSEVNIGRILPVSVVKWSYSSSEDIITIYKSDNEELIDQMVESLNKSIDMSKSTLIGFEDGETVFNKQLEGNYYIMIGKTRSNVRVYNGSIICLNNSPFGTGYILINV